MACMAERLLAPSSPRRVVYIFFLPIHPRPLSHEKYVHVHLVPLTLPRPCLQADNVHMTLYANPYLANDPWGNASSTYRIYTDGLAKGAFVQ